MSEGNSTDTPNGQQEVCIDEKSQAPTSSTFYSWTVGLFSKFLSTEESTSDKHEDHAEAVEVGMDKEDGTIEQEVGEIEDPSESSSDKVADINQLIDEVRTDSEIEDIDEGGELTAPIDPQKDLGHTYVHGMKARVRSHELLRHPPIYRSSRFKKPERPRSIRFDDTAVLLDAASEGDVDEVSRLLTQLNVDANISNEKGVTALHRAAGYGQTDVIQILLSEHAHVNVADMDRWTPLHNAASAGALEAVQILLHNSANVEAETEAGDTAIDLTEVPEILQCLNKTLQSKLTSTYVKALYDFAPDPDAPDELEFHEGDSLKILNRDNPEWWLAELDGRQGYIPRRWVQ